MNTKYKSFFILLALWLLMFSSSSQFLIMAPILPEICRQLHVDESLLGLLITAYSLTLGIVALFTGVLSDNLGRRKIMLVGTFIMALALLLHYAAYNYFSLLIIRVLAGVAGGILTGSCVSFVRDYFPYKKRGWANGVIATGSAVGQIAGIPIGVVFAKKYGFATPFVGFGVIMVMAFILVYLVIPKIIENEHRIKLNPQKIIKSYSNIMTYRIYRIMSVVYILMFFSITVFLVYFPKWLEATFRADANQIATVFFFGGCASLLASPIAGKLTDTIGRKPITIVSNLALAITLIVFLLANLNYVQSIIIFSLIMLFISARLISFQSLASDLTIFNNRGQVMCLMIAIGQIGMALGSGFAGLLYTVFNFKINVITAILTSAVMAIIIWKRLPSQLTKSKSNLE